MIKKILNTGCGDIRPGVGRNKAFKNIGFNLDMEYYPNVETIASIEHLPFPDNSFHTVFCSHVLEHIYNPYHALKEMKRVASYQVILIIPHISDRVDGKHIYSWTMESFDNLLSKVFKRYYIYGSFNRMKKHLVLSGRLKLIKRVFYIRFLSLMKVANEHIAICRVLE